MAPLEVEGKKRPRDHMRSVAVAVVVVVLLWCGAVWCTLAVLQTVSKRLIFDPFGWISNVNHGRQGEGKRLLKLP